MDEAKKSAVSNLVLNDETIYEFNNNALASPDSPALSSAAVVSQINEDVAKLQQSQAKQTAHLNSPANHVVSEKVQNLAAQIYTELQRVIMNNNDDDDIVSGLMPLIVNVLESLDLQLIETQQLQVELELMKDDNDQLISAFEKEKAVKKRLEQQLFEYEFHSDEEKQKLNQKINSLESIVKMMELKSKNANDSVGRLEDEKNELKSEFNSLHHRNNELLRSYWDLMERVKLLIGSDDVSNLASLNLNEIRKNVANVLDENLNDVTGGRAIQLEKPSQTAINSNYNLNEMMSMEMENLDDNASLNDVSISLADELKQADKDSLVGQFVNPSDYASINDNYGLNGMEKEVENLIKENNELLATKNALNIVKDDLIAQVDDLQSKLTLREAENMQMLKVQDVLKKKVEKIEEELKKTLTTNETLKQKLAQKNDDSEEGIPMAQRKRFTRNEMARVLMEKNQLKERLIELQESVKWTDSVIKQNNSRLEQAQKEQRSSIWKFFSNFFTNPSQALNASGNAGDLTNVKYQNANDEVNLDFDSGNRMRMASNIPALESMRRRVKQQQQKSTVQNELMVFMDNDLYSEMKKMNRKGSQVNSANSIVAYGWCLQQQQQKSDQDAVVHLPVPVPIHCRPLATSSQNQLTSQPHSTGLRIWCAAAVDLSGGEAGFPRSKSTLDTSAKDVTFDSDMPAELRNLSPEYKLSTLTWICSVSHSRSKITIVNMKSSPSEILDSFFVKTHLFCICSVPGAKNDDTILDISKDDLSADSVLSERTFTKKSNVTKTADEEPKADDSTSQDKLSNYLNYYKKSSSTETDETGSKEDETTNDPTEDSHKAMSTVLPTMFAGGQNGRIYMYSAVTQWSELIDYVDLSDSVLSINHYRGKVLASLANGELCVFSRDPEGGEWNLRNYIVVNLNNCLNRDADLSPTTENGKANRKVYPIRCSTVAGSNIWCGYRNLVMVFRIDDLKLLNVHAAHSTNEEHVRLLATVSYNDEADQFVICILRLDCVIRIYQNYAPFDCIYTVDLEPTINKFLVCNLSNQRGQRDSQQSGEQELNNKVGVGVINFIRFTATKVTENRIWLGTANGVILTIPHAFDTEKSRPKLVLQDTQLSYHGHKDAVKFIVASKNYVMSGGDGYFDFRLEQESEFGLGSVLSKTDQNHLILWETNMS